MSYKLTNQSSRTLATLADPITISAAQYSVLLRHFQAKTFEIGTSRTDPPPGSVGKWLQQNVTKTAIAFYVGPILIESGCAVKVGRTEIRFI